MCDWVHVCACVEERPQCMLVYVWFCTHKSKPIQIMNTSNYNYNLKIEHHTRFTRDNIMVCTAYNHLDEVSKSKFQTTIQNSRQDSEPKHAQLKALSRQVQPPSAAASAVTAAAVWLLERCTVLESRAQLASQTLPRGCLATSVNA